MAATIKDIAREAGVSDTTVSLVFSAHPRISGKTREKVMAAAARLKYYPNLSARSLRGGGGKVIGFVINDIANPFYAQMIQRAETLVGERGYQLMVADSQWDTANEVKAVETMISSRVKGLLVNLTERTVQSLRLLAQAAMPLVVVDTCPPFFDGCFIGNDLVAAGRMAARHLLEVGCRRPAFLTASPGMRRFSAFVNLRKGFLEVVKEHSSGLAEPLVIQAGLTIEEGATAFEGLRRSHPEVDGVFCANDLCALGVMTAADREGVRIGDDLRVMGIDDLAISRLPRLSLTSIRQPFGRIVEIAVEALFDAIERNALPTARQTLLPELIVRNTTKIK